MDATDLEAGADANREYKDSVFTLLFGDPSKAASFKNQNHKNHIMRTGTFPSP